MKIFYVVTYRSKNTKYQVSLGNTALPKKFKKLDPTTFTTSKFSSPPKIRGVHNLFIELIIYTNTDYKFLMSQFLSLKGLSFFANKVTLHT